VSGSERGASRLTATGRECGPYGEPFLLEFVGLPGAGKTAVAARLVSQLRARGTTCAERRRQRDRHGGTTRRRIRRAVFLLRNHELTQASLRFAASVRPVSLTRLARALRLSGWARQLQSYAASDVDVVVLDQGPVQDAWSITVPGGSWGEAAMRAAVGRVMQATQMPRAFVYVDVDTETASERLRLRRGGSSRFDRLGATQTRTWLARYERSLSSVFQYAVAVSNAPFVRVDGRLPADEVCRQVARFLGDVRTGSAECVPWATVAAEDAS
jgi:thymidylate kinase